MMQFLSILGYRRIMADQNANRVSIYAEGGFMNQISTSQPGQNTNDSTM